MAGYRLAHSIAAIRHRLGRIDGESQGVTCIRYIGRVAALDDHDLKHGASARD